MATSDPIADFLMDWCLRTMFSEDQPDVDRLRLLALQCRNDASTAGIRDRDLDARVGDLERFLGSILIEDQPLRPPMVPPRVDAQTQQRKRVRAPRQAART